MHLRPASAGDADAIRALVRHSLDGVPYHEPLVAALDAALDHPGPEYQLEITTDADSLCGIVIYGETAGTRGAGRVYLIAVSQSARRQHIGTQLLEAACDRLREIGCRFVMVEIPGDGRLAGAYRLCRAVGFAEEARVDDFASDGVALLLLRRPLRPTPPTD